MPPYKLDELLWRHKNLFLNDFDYWDIRFDHDNPFTNAESEAILKEQTRNLQFDRMCFLVSYRKYDQDDLKQRFLMVLARDYKWIAEQLEITSKNHEMNRNDNEIEQFRTALYRSEIPRTGDLSVFREEWLWKVQQAVKALQSGNYLVLKSKVGFGKKWIAKDSCANYGVFNVMQNDVFWINLNNCDNDEALFDKLFKLRLMLNNDDFDYKVQTIDSEYTHHKVDNLKRLLRNILTKYHKHCLLILCGVSSSRALNVFDLGCKTLVTTKNMEIFHDIREAQRKTIEINLGFTRDEAIHLFHKATRIPEIELHRLHYASYIYDKCKGHPFIISSIAKSFYDLERSYMRVEIKQWTDWLQKLDTYKIDTYDNKENIKRVICQLSPDMQKYYRSLSVFKNDANISFKVLETYWDKNETDVKHIINCFHKLSLIEVSQVRNQEWRNPSPRRGSIVLETGKKMLVCSLHFIYYSYLLNELTPNEICQMHQNLVNRYGVHELVNDHRAEPKIVDIPDDNYFYYYIGHHLLEAKMVELFPKLYFDFEFLEGKIRAIGLPNTLGDLQIYVNHIADGNYYTKQLLQGLVEFLQSIEEILLKSPDTCLLQYAFNSKDSIVSKEAERQISKFRDRVWFRDSDHSYRYRFIIQIPGIANMVKFFKDPNASLSVLNNNSILLKDMSQEGYVVNNTEFKGHESRIKAINILDDEYFVSLDENGSLRLWSIKDTPVGKRLTRERIDDETINFPVHSPRQRNYKSFDGTHTGIESHLFVLKTMEIQCMYFIEKLKYLIVADKTGLVFTIQREKNILKVLKDVRFETKLSNITSLVYMEHSGYLFVLNEKGIIYIFDLQNYALVQTIDSRASNMTNELPMGFHVKETSENITVFCVYETKVNLVDIAIITENRYMLPYEKETFYVTTDNIQILCSAMSEDQNYLMLGTTNGIKVINAINQTELPCRNLNDEITSIDVYTVNDGHFEHYILSSTKKNGNFITFQATTKVEYGIEWATDGTSSPSLNIHDMQNPDHLNKSLMGNKIFEVRYVEEEIELILPDDQNRVQLRKSKNNFKARTNDCTNALTGKVTAISVTSDCIWIGCNDGKMYEIKDAMVLESIRNSDANIVYLKHFSKLMLIGTDEYYYFNGSKQEFHKRIAKAMEIDDDGTIVVIHTDCSFNVFNARKSQILENKELQGEDFREAAVSKGNYLMIGLQNNHIYAFTLPLPREMNKQYLDFNTEISTHRGLINCMALSADASVLAVGFTHGTIEIIKLEKSSPPTFLLPIEILNCNESVNDLLFSPWVPDTNANTPIVLQTVNKAPIRRSARFRPPSQSMSPDKRENALSASNRFTFNPVCDNLWQNKKGSSDKPELLACIRLSGQAEKIVSNKDFTQFVTVDNEGEIYHLRLFDSSSSSPNIPFM